MKPASASADTEKKEKIFRKGGKEFSLFPKLLKNMEIKCAKTGEVFNNIPIHLAPTAINNSPIYLGAYNGVSLAIHGVQVDAPINKNIIIAFGMENDDEPTMAAKATCFRNCDQLITSINNHLSGFSK